MQIFNFPPLHEVIKFLRDTLLTDMNSICKLFHQNLDILKYKQ